MVAFPKFRETNENLGDYSIGPRLRVLCVSHEQDPKPAPEKPIDKI
jgi:hypothetical protein